MANSWGRSPTWEEYVQWGNAGDIQFTVIGCIDLLVDKRGYRMKIAWAGYPGDPEGWDCLCPGDPMGDSPDVQEAFERFLEEAKYVIPPTDERQIVLDVITAHISRGTRWAAAAKQLKDQGWLQTPEGDDEEQWLLKDEERIELQKRPGWARQFSREEQCRTAHLLWWLRAAPGRSYAAYQEAFPRSAEDFGTGWFPGVPPGGEQAAFLLPPAATGQLSGQKRDAPESADGGEGPPQEKKRKVAVRIKTELLHGAGDADEAGGRPRARARHDDEEEEDEEEHGDEDDEHEDD